MLLYLIINNYLSFTNREILITKFLDNIIDLQNDIPIIKIQHSQSMNKIFDLQKRFDIILKI